MKFPDEFRIPEHVSKELGTPDGLPYGCFIIPAHHAGWRDLKVIADNGEVTGWEHVSVSILDQPHKTPSWDEMCAVKKLFWNDDETAIQLHVATEHHINLHPGCLHLWRPINAPIPLPPKECV